MTRIRIVGATVLILLATIVGLQPNPRGATAEPLLPSDRPSASRRPAVDDSKVPRVSAEQVHAWRKQFPYRSMAERLSYEAERAPKTSPPMTKEVEQALNAPSWSDRRESHRAYSLRVLHEEKVEEFIVRSGFGQGRMFNSDPMRPHIEELPDFPPIAADQVSELASKTVNYGRKVSLPDTREAAQAAGGSIRLMPATAELDAMHTEGVSNFTNPVMYGYVKSRKEVVGFESHSFLYDLRPPPDSARPAPKLESQRKRWKAVRVELASLLKHDTPRVYVSRHLPKMEKLAKAETRELTKFEAEALAKLHAGDDVAVEAQTNRIEMLGAIRAMKDCRQCHEVPLGTLLGAFSYDLRRDPPFVELIPD